MYYAVEHAIRVDPALTLVEVTLSGVLTPEDLAWIGEEIRAAVRSLGAQAGQHLTLYDARGVAVLPQATAALIVQTFLHPAVIPIRARRLAFVVSTVLARRQLRRLESVLPSMAVFDDRAAALAWLLTEPRAVRVRPFKPGDAPLLAALFHASVHGGGSKDYSPEQCAAWSAAVPDPALYRQRAETGRLLVAVDTADRPIAYGDLKPDGYIDHLYCSPAQIGTGAGSALLAALEAAAGEAGIARLTVDASEAARRLLARRGFRLEGRNDFAIAGVAIHSYRMSKPIG